MFPTKITIPDHLQKKAFKESNTENWNNSVKRDTKNAQRKSPHFAVVLRGKRIWYAKWHSHNSLHQLSLNFTTFCEWRAIWDRASSHPWENLTRVKHQKKTPVITFLLPHQDNPRIIYTWNVKSSIKHFLLLKSHQTSLRGELQPPPVAKRRRRGETETRPKPDYEKDIKKWSYKFFIAITRVVRFVGGAHKQLNFLTEFVHIISIK